MKVENLNEKKGVVKTGSHIGKSGKENEYLTAQ